MTTWKVVDRAPLYFISNDGQVMRRDSRRILRAVVNIHGYPVVCLRGDNRNINGRVHKLVADAFLGPANGLEVNHKDGDKLNNRVENLEYVTRKQNAAHAAVVIKTYPSGSKVKNARLVESDIPKIWAMREQRTFIAAIAQHFGVSVGTICWVLSGGTWRKESEALGKLEPRSTATA